MSDKPLIDPMSLLPSVVASMVEQHGYDLTVLMLETELRAVQARREAGRGDE